MPGMTAQDALERKPASTQSAVALDRLDRITGTGRRVTTRWRYKRANGELIKLDNG